jgi:hypothetical protein
MLPKVLGWGIMVVPMIIMAGGIILPILSIWLACHFVTINFGD